MIMVVGKSNWVNSWGSAKSEIRVMWVEVVAITTMANDWYVPSSPRW
jgi:hypothetical protein